MFFAWYRKADSGNAQVMTQELFRVNSCLLEADGKIQGSSVAPNGGVTAGEKNPGRTNLPVFPHGGVCAFQHVFFLFQGLEKRAEQGRCFIFSPSPRLPICMHHRLVCILLLIYFNLSFYFL